MITVGKWTIRKTQDKDHIWFGSWIATSPWYREYNHYKKEFHVAKTWQEAVDHVNEKVAAR